MRQYTKPDFDDYFVKVLDYSIEDTRGLSMKEMQKMLEDENQQYEFAEFVINIRRMKPVAHPKIYK